MPNGGQGASQQPEPKTITVSFAKAEALHERTGDSRRVTPPTQVRGLSFDWGSENNLRILLLGPDAVPKDVPNAPEINIQVYVNHKPVGKAVRFKAAAERKTDAPATTQAESDPHYYEIGDTVTVTSVIANFEGDNLSVTLNTAPDHG